MDRLEVEALFERARHAQSTARDVSELSRVLRSHCTEMRLERAELAASAAGDARAVVGEPGVILEPVSIARP